jgi:hypothetical protein
VKHALHEHSLWNVITRFVLVIQAMCAFLNCFNRSFHRLNRLLSVRVVAMYRHILMLNIGISITGQFTRFSIFLDFIQFRSVTFLVHDIFCSVLRSWSWYKTYFLHHVRISKYPRIYDCRYSLIVQPRLVVEQAGKSTCTANDKQNLVC